MRPKYTANFKTFQITMKISTGFTRASNPPCGFISISSRTRNCTYNNKNNNIDVRSMKITSSWNPSGNSCNTHVSKTEKIGKKWKEFQGMKNWDGLIEPLHDGLRDEILRYGEFVEAAYRCFNFDTTSPDYATSMHPKTTMLEDCGIGSTGYKVTKYLQATCGVSLPGWMESCLPKWLAIRSSWIGYVAICNDKDEIERLGRRDVVVAYRGTATCMEWMENLRATLTGLPGETDGGDEESESMVQSGFLSLYTSRMQNRRPSLQDSIREEIGKLLEKYSDEPLSITVTGHSLGAALATLTAHDIAATFGDAVALVTAVSFGGPRVGNRSFRDRLEKSGTKVLRIVNSDDPVTRVPGFLLDDGAGSIEPATVKLDAPVGLPSLFFQKVAEDTTTHWSYAEIGRELRLSSRDCPHLSRVSVAACHELKTYLELVDTSANRKSNSICVDR